MKNEVIAIAAIGSKSRALGKDNDLIWKIPEDLAHFKSTTSGHPIIMGYKTWESLPKKPLPNRTNIVLTQARGQSDALTSSLDEPVFINSPEKALEIAKNSRGSEKIYIIGGGQIYKLMLPYTDTLDLTIIEETEPTVADAYFPEYEREFNKVVSKEHKKYEGLKYSFVILKEQYS